MSTLKSAGITMQPFGVTEQGEEVCLFSLTGKDGLSADIMNYGGIVLRIFVPDREGRLADVVLGYGRFEDYRDNNSAYFGAVIGRYANRIAGGKFVLNGKEYELAKNDEPGGLPCHLHGGWRGFDSRVWEAEPVIEQGCPGLVLRRRSSEGEEGYPGNLDVSVSYRFPGDGVFRVEYKASTDRPTPINFTQHSYFNLRGEGRGDIHDHVLSIMADRFLPVNTGLIPTGEMRPVAGTPFDFTSPVEIGERIDASDPQLKTCGGYDHTYVLRNGAREMGCAARLYEPVSGRKLEVWTEEPGLQLYTGNMLAGQIGKSDRPYEKRSGVCLETQHFPDAINHSAFPATVLSPGSVYSSVTEYRFKVC